MKKRFLACISIVAFCLSACVQKEYINASKEKEVVNETTLLERYSDNFLDYFDTVTSVLAYVNTKEEFEDISVYIKTQLEKYHKYYDIYNTYEGINNLKTINDNAGKEAVKVDKEIIDLLLFSKKMYEETEGRVNVAFGSVLKIWHDKREEASLGELKSLPDIKELELAAEHIDINSIIINEEESTVFINDENVRLDVGATAKGYATELLAKGLEEKGYRHILLSVGGNVRAIGTKFNEQGEEIAWSVGIQNPDLSAENKNVAVLKLQDKSLVTSGNYERYFEYEGKKYHHIVNPDTLFPEDEFLSVSIVTSSSAYADAFSTAVFNMPLEKGKAFIESLEDTEAMWILKDKSYVYSKGFKDMEK